MSYSIDIAKRLRGVYFGPNWTGVNLRDKLSEVTWQQATAKVESFHSIATLLSHIDYYVDATIKVLKGGPLDAKDELSFGSPSISSADDWKAVLERSWENAERLASLIERLPDDKLSDIFYADKHGTYFRCLQGPAEHAYYHLGQISLIKSMLSSETKSTDQG